MTSIVKHRAAIALLVAIVLNFSDCDYCPVSAPTVSVVSKCPTTKAEWDEAASRKKCSHMTAKCGTKSPVYHCLLNQWGNETVEVCASTWYISGFCAIYNTEEMKVIDDFNRDCTSFTNGPCPTRYISTDAYMYQGCYGKQNTSTPLPSTDKQVHVSTDCTLPAAIIAIIIVFTLLSFGLFVLLVLTCRGIISKSEINQCIRSIKNTPDEENGKSEGKPPQNVEKKDACFSDGDKISETDSLLSSDQEVVTTPTIIKRDDGVKEKIRIFDPSNTQETRQKDEDKWGKSRKNLKTSLDARDTGTKDENCRGAYEKERDLMYNGRTDSPNVDQTLESKVEVGRTDLPNEDQTVECNSEDKDVIEDDRLPENDLKVTETQNMQSSDEEIKGTENRSKSQKEPENDEKNNAEESSSSSTESDLSSNRENKTSTAKEEQSVAEEATNYVQKMVNKIQATDHKA